MNYHTSAFGRLDYCIVTNKKELRKFRKSHNVPKSELPAITSGAAVTLLSFDTGLIAVVQMLDHEYELNEVIGLLVHECVHIKQFFMENIDEDNPSNEFEAYFMQEVVTKLLRDYFTKTAA